jgi:hypothetical protein
MLGRTLEMLKGCQTMLGMLSDARRKLNRIRKDIRTLGEIGQKKTMRNGTRVFQVMIMDA